MASEIGIAGPAGVSLWVPVNRNEPESHGMNGSSAEESQGNLARP